MSTRGLRDRVGVLGGAAAALAAVAAAALPGAPAGWRPGLPALQPPDWSVIAGEAWVVQLHLGTAATALLIGAALMLGVKGRTLHRRLGWLWAACMMVTAVSSFFIHRTNPGGYSFIHGLSGWTVVSLPMAVWFARRRKIHLHRRMMMGMFYGGLVLAGLLAFLPGRVLHQTFLG